MPSTGVTTEGGQTDKARVSPSTMTVVWLSAQVVVKKFEQVGEGVVLSAR